MHSIALRGDYRAIISAAFLLIASGASSAFAYDTSSKADVNVDANGVILRNVDTTSYLMRGAPAGGSAEFTVVHEGAIYRFASTGERNAFLASPGKFAPAFGGFCAMGAALGKKLDGDPKVYRLINGQLYVFVNEDAAAAWDKDPTGNFIKAYNKWPLIRDRTPKELN